ncbi:MAG: hypothetical protein ACYTAF_05690 [Planctomycetota bacterium]|jgi:hypothetical protein
MKGKGPNLYEILKGSTPAPAKVEKEPEAVQVVTVPARKEPAPKEEKERAPAPEAKAPVAAPPTAPQAAPAPQTPAPAPPPAPVRPMPSVMPVRPAPPRQVVRPMDPSVPKTDGGPGERTVTITYNTAGFLILVVLGLVFVSYSLGVRSGRGDVQPPAPTAPAVEEDRSDAAPAPPRQTPPPVETGQPVFAIHLMKWKANGDKERLSNQNNAQRIIDALRNRGLKGGWYRVETSGRDRFVVLYYGRYTKSEEPMAVEALKKLQGVQIKNRSGTTTFRHALPVKLEE